MTIPTIMEFKPEEVAATVRREGRLDDEKVPTTNLTRLLHRGVVITSRYQKAAEFRRMAEFIERVPEDWVGRVKTIWCDSKATHQYAVVIDAPRSELRTFGEMFGMIAREVAKGHNGFFVVGQAPDGSCPTDPYEGENRAEAMIDPDWVGDDLTEEAHG